MYFNFVRIYQTLRVTPAMAAGLSRHARPVLLLRAVFRVGSIDCDVHCPVPGSFWRTVRVLTVKPFNGLSFPVEC
jgi:hypothetical protein